MCPCNHYLCQAVHMDYIMPCAIVELILCSDLSSGTLWFSDDAHDYTFTKQHSSIFLVWRLIAGTSSYPAASSGF